jgi:hypothetical protein
MGCEAFLDEEIVAALSQQLTAHRRARLAAET